MINQTFVYSVILNLMLPHMTMTMDEPTIDQARIKKIAHNVTALWNLRKKISVDITRLDPTLMHVYSSSLGFGSNLNTPLEQLLSSAATLNSLNVSNSPQSLAKTLAGIVENVHQNKVSSSPIHHLVQDKTKFWNSLETDVTKKLIDLQQAEKAIELELKLVATKKAFLEDGLMDLYDSILGKAGTSLSISSSSSDAGDTQGAPFRIDARYREAMDQPNSDGDILE